MKWCEDAVLYNICPELALMFHIPNERKTSIGEGYFLKKMGVKSGVPDLFLPVPSGIYHGLFIEMKSENGRATSTQKEWLNRLRMQGYMAEICHSAGAAIAVIKNYLVLGE